MGRSRELTRRWRRGARSVLDRAAAALDRLGDQARERLARRHRGHSPPEPAAATIPPARPAPTSPQAEPSASGPDAIDTELAALTKAELYRLAQERDIAGRSKLSKDELVRALEAAD